MLSSSKIPTKTSMHVCKNVCYTLCAKSCFFCLVAASNNKRARKNRSALLRQDFHVAKARMNLFRLEWNMINFHLFTSQILAVRSTLRYHARAKTIGTSEIPPGFFCILQIQIPISICSMQKKPGDYADVPIVLALAWYLNVDFLILNPNLDQPQWITGSMTERSTSSRPPMILGCEISGFCLISFSQNERT